MCGIAGCCKCLQLRVLVTGITRYAFVPPERIAYEALSCVLFFFQMFLVPAHAQTAEEQRLVTLAPSIRIIWLQT